MSEPTQDKDTDLLHADGAGLREWVFHNAPLDTFNVALAALRDEVKRQARVGYVRVEEVNAQVDKLLAENARLRAQLDAAEGQRVTAAWDAQVAEQRARREGAREALTRCIRYLDANSLYMASCDIKDIRDREYPQEAQHPAPSPEAPATRCGCSADRAPDDPCICPTATPAPAGEPVPIEIPVGLHVTKDGMHKRVVFITPADAARIVAMAREVGNG